MTTYAKIERNGGDAYSIQINFDEIKKGLPGFVLYANGEKIGVGDNHYDIVSKFISDMNGIRLSVFTNPWRCVPDLFNMVIDTAQVQVNNNLIGRITRLESAYETVFNELHDLKRSIDEDAEIKRRNEEDD